MSIVYPEAVTHPGHLNGMAFSTLLAGVTWLARILAECTLHLVSAGAYSIFM